eukprot:GGOE01037764.1.p1 GENE.GGOE01037764.1~~GGOE01037764.1.p1  ORF type:complete len:252 (+),score=48.15 GGOE01037764.1:83-757(+)
MTAAQVHGLVERARSPQVSTTFLVLSVVTVPDSPAKPCAGYADATMVFEVLYAVLVFNYVLDFSITDLRTHHVGTKTVAFYRHYCVFNSHLLFPPGRMVKLIDMGSYRTRHQVHPNAKSVLNMAYFYTMWVDDAQLDSRARALWRWCFRPEFMALQPLEALRQFTEHFQEEAPEFASSLPRVHQVDNVRHYRVPSRGEVHSVATTFRDTHDFHWQQMPVHHDAT